MAEQPTCKHDVTINFCEACDAEREDLHQRLADYELLVKQLERFPELEPDVARHVVTHSIVALTDLIGVLSPVSAKHAPTNEGDVALVIQAHLGTLRQIHQHELVRLIYGERAGRESKARADIVREIVRAKRDAGFRADTVFFRDVWPVALAALKKVRQEDANQSDG